MSDHQTESSNNKSFKELRTLSVGEAVAYSLPNAGSNAVLGILVSFSILYYVNIMGMPPIFAGGIFSIAMYAYAFLCPVFGALCDKIQTRFGRKKTVLLITAPPYMIFFLLLWLSPRPTSEIEFGAVYLPIIIWFAVFLISFRICGSAFYATYTALLPEISTDEKNRVMVSTVNMLVMIGGTTISMLGPIILLGNATEGLSRDTPDFYYPNSEVGRSIAEGVLIFAVLMMLFFIITFIVMMVVIKEPEIESCEFTMSQVLTDLKEPFKDKNSRSFLLAYFLFWIPLVSLNYLLMNLLTFIFQLRGSEYITFAVVIIGAAVAAFLVWNNLSEKIGLKKTTTICIIILIISYLLIYPLTFPMEHSVRIVFGFFVSALLISGFVGAMIFPWAILSDIVDTAEMKTGRTLSGAYSGAFNFVLSFGAATSMLLISVFLEIWGPQSPTSYAIVFLFGALLLTAAVIVFQRVIIIGTDARREKLNS